MYGVLHFAGNLHNTAALSITDGILFLFHVGKYDSEVSY